MSTSARFTLGVGGVIARHLGPGGVVCLEGGLGTGKTVLVSGIARGLGFGGVVQSPTFVIIREYPEIELCHVDAFRLAGPDDLIQAGIDEYLDARWRCAVEWAGIVRPALPADALDVRIGFGDPEEERSIVVRGSRRWRPLLDALERGEASCE